MYPAERIQRYPGENHDPSKIVESFSHHCSDQRSSSRTVLRPTRGQQQVTCLRASDFPTTSVASIQRQRSTSQSTSSLMTRPHSTRPSTPSRTPLRPPSTSG